MEKVTFNHNVLIEYSGNIESTGYILEQIVVENLPIYSFTPKAMTLEDLYLQLFRPEVSSS